MVGKNHLNLPGESVVYHPREPTRARLSSILQLAGAFAPFKFEEMRMKHMMILAAIGMAAASIAQSSPLINTSGMSIRAGGAYILESKTRKITGNMINVGADFELPQSYLKNGTSYFSVDWFGKSGSGAKGNFFPVMINQRFGNPDAKNYSFLGVGAVFVDITQSKTVFGVRGGLGQRLGDSLFAEASAIFSSNAGGAKANAVVFNIGYKF
jgi:hypothetical protein